MMFDRGVLINNVAGLAGAAKTLGMPKYSHDKTFGLERMCVGGGQGIAMIVERLL